MSPLLSSRTVSHSEPSGAPAVGPDVVDQEF